MRWPRMFQWGYEETGFTTQPERCEPVQVKQTRSPEVKMYCDTYIWPDMLEQRSRRGSALQRLIDRSWEFYNKGEYEIAADLTHAADLIHAAEELKAYKLQEIKEKGT